MDYPTFDKRSQDDKKNQSEAETHWLKFVTSDKIIEAKQNLKEM
jgi:hypothetical protein